jgi:16S rRNA (cytidine1402-2'-O)-methyltransferase
VNNSSPNDGALYVVATPIGHLDDLSVRALRVLQEADLVLAEDTRRTVGLLRHFGVDNSLQSLHEHNEAARCDDIVARLNSGDNIALVSDAGTPLVSDPGYLLVRAAVQAGCRVIPVPGPCAATAALSVAGIATHRFVFEGFLPARGGPRRERLLELAREARTVVFYEAPHRLSETLTDIAKVLGDDREMAVARELTKLYEQVVTGPVATLLEAVELGTIPALGEIVLVVSGFQKEVGADVVPQETDAWLRALAPVLAPTAAARVAAKATGQRRSGLYKRLLELDSST